MPVNTITILTWRKEQLFLSMKMRTPYSNDYFYYFSFVKQKTF